MLSSSNFPSSFQGTNRVRGRSVGKLAMMTSVDIELKRQMTGCVVLNN